MKPFLDRLLDHLDLDPKKREDFLYRATPRFIMEIMRKYFRLQVEGAENIPKSGPLIFAPNHSGFSGFDAMVLAHEVFKCTGKAPRVLTHHFWFLNKTTAIPAQKLGFIEASTKSGLEQLKKKKSIILFPEGEYGNFKPSIKAYQLQEFKRGFVRMAIQTEAAIVPTLIVGAEETHINLSQLKLTRFLRGTVLPLPLNILPLPAKWKIQFLPAIKLPYKVTAVKDRELMYEIAEEIREEMQKHLIELRK